MPTNGGLLHSGSGLCAPDFPDLGSNSPKVSGRDGEYSHFRETGARDRVRAATVWRSCSGSAEYVAVLSTQATVPGRLTD
jgi:hypothetical protein